MRGKFGPAFEDQWESEQGEGGRRRAMVFTVVGMGLMVLVIGRLVQLQVIFGVENLRKSEENRLEMRTIMAPRGTIFDRHGTVLTRNVPVVRQRGDTAEEVVGREYIYGDVFSHIIGYVGEVSKEEITQSGGELKLGDMVGKMGIEKVWDDQLRGRDGGEIIERGSDGGVLRAMGTYLPQVGADVQLTLDLGLQRWAVEALGERLGAVIVSQINGEVLALASGPTFDPARVEDFVNREDKPIFNRALGGLYPPGSVFKIVTAAAGLEEAEIDANSQIEDTGEIKVGEFRYGNWYFDQYGKTEGMMDVVRALQRSNDIFFYRVAEKLGPDKLAEWAKTFGLGEVVDVGLGGAAGGLVPTPEWKERMKGERWFLGNTYHMGIGQGDFQLTPLQVHLMTSIIAAEGRKCRLRVAQVEQVEQVCEEIGLSVKTVDLIREGMVAACSSEGTAFPFFEFSPQVACKTGTAQFGDAKDRTHAWFVVFAPEDNPEIVVTVLLEAGGEGSSEAAPVAKEILEYWFKQR